MKNNYILEINKESVSLLEKEEYGIAMIKPDGVEKEGFISSLMWRFRIYCLKVVRTKRIMLTREQVKNTISTNFDVNEYLDYIAEKELIVFLLKGENCIAKIIEIKQNVRSKFGFSSLTMKNLLHSPDCGNEYYEHFKLFFPELPIEKYGAYADMTIPLDRYSNSGDLLKYMNESNLTKYGFLCTERKQIEVIKDIGNSNCFIGYICKTNFENKLITIICYLEFINAINNADYFLCENELENLVHIAEECGGITVLDYYEKEDYRSTIAKLNHVGVDGVVVYDPRYSKEKVAELEVLCEDDLGMLLLGGTHGIEHIGSLGADKETFNKYIKRMNKKKDKFSV